MVSSPLAYFILNEISLHSKGLTSHLCSPSLTIPCLLQLLEGVSGLTSHFCSASLTLPPYSALLDLEALRKTSPESMRSSSRVNPRPQSLRMFSTMFSEHESSSKALRIRHSSNGKRSGHA